MSNEEDQVDDTEQAAEKEESEKNIQGEEEAPNE